MKNKLGILWVIFFVNFIAVNPAVAIESNPVFVPQKTRIISQPEMKVAQGIGSRVIKLRLADSGVSVY